FDHRLRGAAEGAERAQDRQGQDVGPRLGRGSHRVRQSDAPLVGVALLSHHRVLARLPRVLPGAGQLSRPARLDPGRPARGRYPLRRGGVRADLRALRRAGARSARPERGSACDRAEALSQPLRAVPRFRRRRQPWIPQSDRRGLAVGRDARRNQGLHYRRAAWRDAADGRGRRRRRKREGRRALLPLAVGPHSRPPPRVQRQGEIPAGVRRLPRGGRKGQPAVGRPQPYGRCVAARLGGNGDRRADLQRPLEPDARAQGSALAGEDPSPHGVRVLAVAGRGSGRQVGADREQVWPSPATTMAQSVPEVAHAGAGGRPSAAAMPEAAATTELYAADRKIYPRAVHGWFAAWRWMLVWATQLVFYGGAWLTWNGRQAVLFDIVQRKFYVFGLVFWPQD